MSDFILDIISFTIIYGFIFGSILNIYAINRMRKYKKENADLKSEILRKEYEEECK